MLIFIYQSRYPTGQSMFQKLLSKTSSLEIDLQNSCPLAYRKIRCFRLINIVDSFLPEILDVNFSKSHEKDLSTFIFEIEIKNQCKKWTLTKRLAQFIKFQEKLKSQFDKNIPSIPVRSQKDLSEANTETMLDFLQVFMTKISKENKVRESKTFKKFIGNLVPEHHRTMKVFQQLEMHKKAGGRHNESFLKKMFCFFLTWTYNYFTITNEGVYYTAKDDSFEIKEMLAFAYGFQLTYGLAKTGFNYGITLRSCQRVLRIDAVNLFNLSYFVYALKMALEENSTKIQANRFGSFAPVREECSAKSYVDGFDYFGDVYDTIMKAKREVMITGWMVSPYFCLKRPDPEENTRVDRTLYKVASLGVKVFIIVFMEPKIALNIDSEFTEDYLSSLHPNIKVVRHPQYVLIPFLWSHHQKMVIVDQKVAFMGGLDIGYGRMDTSKHFLNDENNELWKGVDFCNYRKTDILKPKEYTTCSIDRSKQARMPWHDITVRISGGSVLDLARHFVQYWNYVNFQKKMNQRELLVYAGVTDHDHHESKEQQIDPKEDNFLQALQKKVSKQEQERKMIASNRQAVKENVEKETRKKYSSSAVFSNIEDAMNQDSLYQKRPSEMPKPKKDPQAQEIDFYSAHLKEETNSQKLDHIFKVFTPSLFLGQGFEELIANVFQNTSLILPEDKKTQQHQLLRSASMWGLGLQKGKEEKSILEAYVNLIQTSKEFIYIENQFFICVQNPVSKVIKERIIRAHLAKERFKIIVVVPSLPGFDGEVDDENAAVFRVQIYHMYNTICKGEQSIFGELSYISNIHEYIQFYCPRAHGKVNGNPVTELIYVHSKLMIVDDTTVLIGSANINDRSLLGARDSEIAIVIKEDETIKIQTKEGKQREVNKFAYELRTQLFMEHFGLTLDEVSDYHNWQTWKNVKLNAQKNQQIYRSLFGCYPDNEMKKFKDIEKIKKEADCKNYDELAAHIKGNAVPFQYDFLSKQNLALKPSQKEFFVPGISFT